MAHAIEFVLLFFAAPTLFAFTRHRILAIPALWVLTAWCLFVLVRDPLFPRERLWNPAPEPFPLGPRDGRLSRALRLSAGNRVSRFPVVHIVFRNSLAVVLTLFGGFLFAFRYLQTDSLFVSSFEHALYGCAVFTIGVGQSLHHGANRR